MVLWHNYIVLVVVVVTVVLFCICSCYVIGVQLCCVLCLVDVCVHYHNMVGVICTIYVCVIVGLCWLFMWLTYGV